jgi:hypothetical protein
VAVLIDQSVKDRLKEMRIELEEKSREEAREAGLLNSKGKKIDQIELCYKQHTPAQCTTKTE